MRGAGEGLVVRNFSIKKIKVVPAKEARRRKVIFCKSTVLTLMCPLSELPLEAVDYRMFKIICKV
jgi:hypothetical protein